mmetsp:Transcript_91304/g.164868  ORF Transcript_91304/g.164868 Transcript_91304/m.164868 type:complete len:281 (+) Transcript_91304:60-902(+)
MREGLSALSRAGSLPPRPGSRSRGAFALAALGVGAAIGALFVQGTRRTHGDQDAFVVGQWAVSRDSGRSMAVAVATLGRGSRIVRTAISSVEGEEFVKARDRIRRIQLGLGKDDPLPEEGSLPVTESDVFTDAPVVPLEGLPKPELEEGIASKPEAVASEPNWVDGVDLNAKKSSEDLDEDDLPPVADAFAGKDEDVPELKPLESTKPKKDSPNIFQLLVTDLGLITLPSTGQVAITFGIVILLVAGYTGFIAVVDYSAQQALGTVFSEFYKAARPEAPG